MGSRRRSRELAMQALFCMDIQNNASEAMLERFCENFDLPPDSLSFFLKLVNGVLQARCEIDAVIERFSDHWKIDRMACVDRNVMRVAVYELLYCDDIPPKVSINEAIDIGKKYGTDESGAFINGIMDSIRIALEKNDIRPKMEVEAVNK